MKKITLKLLVVLLSLLVLVPAQSQETEKTKNSFRKSFNPKSCKSGDKAYVYWAAGNHVFRFKYNPLWPLYSLSTEGDVAQIYLDAAKEIPYPPNPMEPEGCYLNPLRGGLVPYMQQYDEVLSRKIIGRNIDNLTSRVGFLVGYFAIPKDARYRPSDINIQLYKKYKKCRIRVSKIQQCVSSNDIDMDDYRVNHILKINKEIFKKIDHIDDLYLSVYADTQSAVSVDNGLVLDGSIVVFDSVRLSSSFRILPVEIDALAKYYEELFGYISKAHIKGYKWNSLKK